MSLKKVKIKSKKSIGVETVYDICVPGAHHYLLDSGVVSHNSGFIYASSIVVAMRKLKLKEDEDGNKVTQVNGIRAACKIMKTRYSKPFESVQIKIPYEHGMDPYSGLLDMFEAKGIVAKTGNKLEYVSPVTGEVIKEFRKQWTSERLQVIIDEWNQHPVVNEAAADIIEPDIIEPSEETADEYIRDADRISDEKVVPSVLNGSNV